MRSFVALFLLLLQLGPMAGAVVCLHDVLARATAECPMGEQAHGATMATSVAPDEAGILRSRVFPGLQLHADALLTGDLARVLAVLQQGIQSPAHAEFVERLRASA